MTEVVNFSSQLSSIGKVQDYVHRTFRIAGGRRWMCEPKRLLNMVINQVIWFHREFAWIQALCCTSCTRLADLLLVQRIASTHAHSRFNQITCMITPYSTLSGDHRWLQNEDDATCAQLLLAGTFGTCDSYSFMSFVTTNTRVEFSLACQFMRYEYVVFFSFGIHTSQSVLHLGVCWQVCN